MTERITWVTCPQCAARAAVGWRDDVPIEFDCPTGCRVTVRELTVLFPAPGINGRE